MTGRFGVRHAFAALLALELVSMLLLAADHRVPRIHDGFEVLQGAYYHLNNAIVAGEVPEWMPHWMYGTVSRRAITTGSFLQNALLLAAPVLPALRHVPYPWIYHASFLLDQAVLILGMLLWSRAWCRTTAGRFTATAAVAVSASWFDQPFFNHHFYYALPLVLHFLHRWLDTGLWRHAFLSGNLLLVQFSGNAQYAPPVQSLAVGVYAAALLASRSRELEAWRASFRRPLPAIAAGLGVAATLAVFAVYMQAGLDGLYFSRPGRYPNGASTIESFLLYAGGANPTMFLEPFTGLSSHLDVSAYVGIAGIALAAFALSARPIRPGLVLAYPAITLALFSLGGFVATVAYHAWPTMKFYRHISYVLPLASIFVAMMAGVGLEAVAEGRLGRRRARAVHACLVVGAAACAALALLADEAAPALREIVLGDYGGTRLVWKPLADPRFFALVTGLGALWYTLTAVLTAPAVLAPTADAPTLARRRARLLLLLPAVLLADLLFMRATQWPSKTVPVAPEDRLLFEFAPVPYAARRNLSEEPNERARAFFRLDPGDSHGAVLASAFTLLQQEDSLPWQRMTAELWSLPVDDLYRAYTNQPLRAYSWRAESLTMVPVGTHPAFPVLVGSADDKLRVFARAHALRDDTAVAGAIRDTRFLGRVLLVTPTREASTLPEASIPLDGDERIPAPTRVTRFDANTLEVEVTLPDTTTGAWLSYAGTWDRHWTATVNGEPVPIARAFLAFQAVPIPGGTSTIRFRYQHPALHRAGALVRWNSTLWIAGFVLLGLGLVRKEDSPGS